MQSTWNKLTSSLTQYQMGHFYTDNFWNGALLCLRSQLSAHSASSCHMNQILLHSNLMSSGFTGRWKGAHGSFSVCDREDVGIDYEIKRNI